ncbi:MAG: metallophosphoesterase [Chloroflexota bacterium]
MGATANGPPIEQSVVSRRAFLRLGCGTLLSVVAAGVLAPVYATRLEPRWLQVTRRDILLPDLPEALEGFTVVQLSDFHLGPHVSAEDVRRSVRATNALEADLIVLTGDFVYRSASYGVPCARELASLRSRYGVCAVLGNHDIWTDPDAVATSLTEAGIVVLRNERQALEVGGTRLWLLGIEDTGYTGFLGSPLGDFRAMWQKAAAALTHLLKGIPDAEPRLLLVHNPDFTEMLPEGRIDLGLCGHTHGGQVRLPFIGAPVLPSCFGQKYTSGLVRGLRTLVYVNRGIGLISPPVRLNCRPEITILSLWRSLSPSPSNLRLLVPRPAPTGTGPPSTEVVDAYP